MSKSKRTQTRYAKSWKSQTALDQFGFSVVPRFTQHSANAQLHPSAESAHTQEAPEPTTVPDSPSVVVPSVRPASVLSVSSDSCSEQSNAEEQADEEDESEEDIEDWEEALDDAVQGNADIRDWEVLREQIKTTLRKKSKQLPLTQINQLMILTNFATLRLKGYTRNAASLEIAKQWHNGDGVWFARRICSLARHYQVFEQLPIEKRGGRSNSKSWLHNESVKHLTREWLSAQPTGKVTPKALQRALNTTIFPQLNITPKKPFCDRTARRWLIKLGWRQTVVRKGVYMDGHERDDVVKYRQEVFLPAIAKYEARMNRYEGPDLKKVEPNLKPGEKRVVGVWHDESCFHGNEEVRSLWCVLVLLTDTS